VAFLSPSRTRSCSFIIAVSAALAASGCGGFSDPTPSASSSASATTTAAADYVDARQAICDKYVPRQESLQRRSARLEQAGAYAKAAELAHRANAIYIERVHMTDALPTPPGSEAAVATIHHNELRGIRFSRQTVAALRVGDLKTVTDLFREFNQPSEELAQAFDALGMTTADC
jgi:hypothetical protein